MTSPTWTSHRSTGRPADDLADELLKKLPQVPAALRELVTAGADGNPFYMEELVKMLIDQGAIRTGEHWSVDADKLLSLKVPPTLTGVLQARLDGLPAQERRALQLASVIGLKFWDAALAHVEPQAAEQLPSLRRRELIVARGCAGQRAASTPSVTRSCTQVTYDTLLKRDKRDAHARTAQWLAQHARRSSPRPAGDRRRALCEGRRRRECRRVLCRARPPTTQPRSPTSRRSSARRARLALASPDDQRVTLAIAGNTRANVGPAGTARISSCRTSRACWRWPTPCRRAPRAMRGGRRRPGAAATSPTAWANGRASEREARRALQLAERAGAEDVALRAMQRLAQALAFQGDPAAGLAIAEAGLARATAFQSPVAQSRLANAMSLCAAEQGDQAASLRHDLSMLGYCRQAGDRRSEAVALINAGVGYLRFGAHPQARQHLEESLRLNRTLGNRVAEGGSLAGLSELALREGDAAAALLHAQAALDILLAADSRLYQIDALHNLGNAQLALGQWTEAQEAFERVEALAREIDISTKMPNALEGQARVALARGDVATAAGSGAAAARSCRRRRSCADVPCPGRHRGTSRSPDATRGVAREHGIRAPAPR